MWEISERLLLLSNIISKLCFAICGFAVFYQLILILVSLRTNKRLSYISKDFSFPKKTRFAVVIAARNEESVIAALIASLKVQDYPHELFDIFVIADNCTDQTAAQAKNAGAKVYQRYDRTRCTKGFALQWFFERYFRNGYQHDACIIFDADNLVDPAFLAVMDRHFQSGSTIAVGYRDSTNPSETAISSANSIFWLHQTRFLHQARTNLGLPLTSVSGTGFMFAIELIQESGWNTQTLTEDTEFTTQMILRGQKPLLVREAIFYDEQTTHLKVMLRQRWRWAVGTTQTARLMLPQIVERISQGELSLLDCCWYFIQIPVYTLVSSFSVLRFVLLLPLFNPSPMSFVEKCLPLFATYLCTVLLTCFLLWLEGKSLRTYRKGIVTYPGFALIWGLQQIFAIFKRNLEWKPIKHRSTYEIKRS